MWNLHSHGQYMRVALSPNFCRESKLKHFVSLMSEKLHCSVLSTLSNVRFSDSLEFLSPSLKTCSVFPCIKQRKLSVTWLFLCLAITLFLICLHFFTTSSSGTHFNLASILITPLLLLSIISQFSSVWRIFLCLSHLSFFFFFNIWN